MNVAVCHANTHPPTAGIGNFAYNVARSLADDGYEFHLFVRGGRSYEVEREGNLTVHRCPYVKAYPFNNHVHRFFVDRRLSSIGVDIDVLHLHSPISPPLKADVPTVATVHTPLEHKGDLVPKQTLTDYLHSAQRIVGKRIERHIIEKSDVLTTVSESVRADLSEYEVTGRDIRITHNGVDTAEFDPDAPAAENTLLYTGRLAGEKGLPDLLEAIAALRSSGTDCRLVITGTGDYADVLRSQATDLGIADQVEFTGFVSRERLVSLYETATAFVFPTYYEGLPTSVLEAMAAGVPVVSTTAPGVVDLIDHEETGLLGEPGDVDALAANVERILADESLRTRLGWAGRRRAETRYDWDVVSETVRSIYEEVAARSS